MTKLAEVAIPSKASVTFISESESNEAEDGREGAGTNDESSIVDRQLNKGRYAFEFRCSRVEIDMTEVSRTRASGNELSGW